MKDLFGQAILDYQTGNSPEDLYTETSISELDVMPIDYLFRGYKDMPTLEQKALDLSKGKILDVGCGAGSHSPQCLLTAAPSPVDEKQLRELHIRLRNADVKLADVKREEA